MRNVTFKEVGRILLVVLVLMSGNISATNYYVSMSDGKDSNNGTSKSTPWKTLTHIDNGTAFKAGDSILFKCGDRWSVKTNRHYATSSVFTYSGTVNNRIVFSSYGTGLKPKIYGAIPVLGFTAHPTLSNVYKCDSVIDNDLNNIQGAGGATGSALAIVDGKIIWMDGALQRKTSFGGLTNNWDWYWENKSLYFYYDGNINDIDTIEVMQSAWGITLSGSYVTIDGLSLRYWASRCIGNYPEKTRYGIEIRNCEISYTAFKRSGVGYGISMASSDMIIENNEIHHNGRRNISLNVYTDDVIMRNVIIQNNSLHSGYHTTGVDIHQASPSATGYITNIYIRNNHIWEDSETFDYTDSEVLFLQNGDQGSADETHLDSIYFYNNLVTDIEMDGIYMQGTGPTVYYCYNTLTGSSSYRRGFIFSGGTYNEKHIVLMNNIFLNKEGHMATINGPSDKSLTLDTMDYNIHFTPNNLANSLLLDDVFSSDYSYSDTTKIRGLGVGVHSFFNSEPCFVDSLSDWNLKTSSPAIKNGFPMPWLTTIDYYGNERDPNNPTIGAIEYITEDASSANILGFSISGYTEKAVINKTNHTVSLELAGGTNITNLTPTISVSKGASINPGSGVAQNFTSPVTYTVTSQDGTTKQAWVVNITTKALSTANDILTFSIPQQTGAATINKANHTISLEVSGGTSLSSLVPTITLSSGASVSPSSGVAQNFTSPVTYTVTAEDGTTKQAWVVTVTAEPLSTENDIVKFSIPQQTSAATINSTNHTVTLEVTSSSNLSSLTPTITVSSGASISPKSGVAQDFTSPVSYTVTAEDGVTKQTWVVTVTKAVTLSSATDILTFSIPEQTSAAVINKISHTINIEVTTGTNVTALIPAFTISGGASSNPKSGVSQNFTTTVTFTITAEDGTIQNWTITVTVKSDNPVENNKPEVDIIHETEIYKGFVSILDASGTTDKDDDALTYNWKIPSGISVSSLTEPVISILPNENAKTGAYNFSVSVSDGKSYVSKNVVINIHDFRPETEELNLELFDVSNYEEGNLPDYIIDKDPSTRWSADGDNQWVIVKIDDDASISHFGISFYNGEMRNSYFDVYASKDGENWDLLLESNSSCGFSSDVQYFEVSNYKAYTTYKYIKLTGHMNSLNEWNSYTEFKSFGNVDNKNTTNVSDNISENVNVYPNPVSDILNINSVPGSTIRFIDLTGKMIYEKTNSEMRESINCNSINNGIYFIQIEKDNSIIYTKKIIIK